MINEMSIFLPLCRRCGVHNVIIHSATVPLIKLHRLVAQKYFQLCVRSLLLETGGGGVVQVLFFLC